MARHALGREAAAAQYAASRLSIPRSALLTDLVQLARLEAGPWSGGPWLAEQARGEVKRLSVGTISAERPQC